jgi:hypothetical protein
VGTQLLDPLRAFMKVTYCCDPSSIGTLICAKTLATMLRVFATVSK